jgi:flagellar assembly factor FliW
MIVLKLATQRFGDIEVDLEQTITFTHGIPGFDDYKKFIVLQPDPEMPFTFLQSIEEGKLSFILTNPHAFFPDYDIKLPGSVKDELHIESDEDCTVWTIVSVKESIEDATLNLLAPIIINVRVKQGKQVVLNGTPYRTKHPLLPAIVAEPGEGETSDAGAVTKKR